MDNNLFDNPMGTDGFEFVEYTAPDVKALGRLFESMGFTAVAKHRLRVHAELLDSVVLLPMSIAHERIAQRLAESRLGALLARLGIGTGRDLVREVVDALSALQRLVLAVPDAIHSIDVNPLLIGPAGAMAVDALIVPRRPP